MGASFVQVAAAGLPELLLGWISLSAAYLQSWNKTQLEQEQSGYVSPPLGNKLKHRWHHRTPWGYFMCTYQVPTCRVWLLVDSRIRSSAVGNDQENRVVDDAQIW